MRQTEITPQNTRVLNGLALLTKLHEKIEKEGKSVSLSEGYIPILWDHPDGAEDLLAVILSAIQLIDAVQFIQRMKNARMSREEFMQGISEAEAEVDAEDSLDRPITEDN